MVLQMGVAGLNYARTQAQKIRMFELLTQTQKMGHLILLVDVRIKRVVTQFIGVDTKSGGGTS